VNIVLARYYGTVDPAQLPGNVDAEVPIALRRIFDATHQGGVKLSSAHINTLAEFAQEVTLLGGLDKASAALEEAHPWLRAWVEAEEQGRAVAQSVVTSHYDAARVKASEAMYEETTEPPRDLIRELIRSM